MFFDLNKVESAKFAVYMLKFESIRFLTKLLKQIHKYFSYNVQRSLILSRQLVKVCKDGLDIFEFTPNKIVLKDFFFWHNWIARKEFTHYV